MTTVDLTASPVDDRVLLAARLATLVAHPTAPRPFLIDQDGKNAGWPSDVPTAAASGRCYAVTTAPDVVALDVDADHYDPADAHRLADELRAEGRPVLRVESGRPGHLHLWTLALDDLDREHLAERATANGLTVRPGPMRPPGTPHRLGLPVAYLDDPDAFAEAVESVRATPRPHRGDWRDVLASGLWPVGYDDGRHDLSGSAMTFYVCRFAHRAGHDLDAVRSMLADTVNRGGQCYRSHRNRDRWLAESVWPAAVESAGRMVTPPADAAEARERLADIRAAVVAHPRPGIAGATDRAVLLAILDRAHRRGTMTPTMSIREIAEAAGVTRGTASTSTRRIVASDPVVRLQVVERGRGQTVTEAGEYTERANATRWRLSAHTRDTGGTPPASTSLSVATLRARSRAELDACRWRGLGLNAPRLLDALAGGPLRPAELAEALNLHPGTIRRLVRRLAAYGLVVMTEARWHLADDLDDALARAADDLGLTGKAEAVARGHAVERAAYLDHRDEARPARVARKRRAIADDRRPTLPLVPVGTIATPTEPGPPPEPPSTPEDAVYGPLTVAGGRGG